MNLLAESRFRSQAAPQIAFPFDSGLRPVNPLHRNDWKMTIRRLDRLLWMFERGFGGREEQRVLAGDSLEVGGQLRSTFRAGRLPCQPKTDAKPGPSLGSLLPVPRGVEPSFVPECDAAQPGVIGGDGRATVRRERTILQLQLQNTGRDVVQELRSAARVCLCDRPEAFGSNNFGTVSRQANASRDIQLAARFDF